MRTLHRLLAIVAVAGLLWIGVTGTLIQVLDLRTLLSNAPPDDEVMQSIKEGMYGNGPFPVISLRDYRADSLPADLNYLQQFDAVLQAVRRQDANADVRYVELRNVDGAVIGQARVGNQVLAFDAQTGASVQPVDTTLPQPPRTLRQQLKELHRFWIRHDVPGVWFELLCGVALWTLIISGLVMYFRLLKARTKLNRSNLFWVAGGWWRSLHRIVSVIAAVLLILVAFSGTWLGFESVWHSLSTVRESRDPSATLSDADVTQMVPATLAAVRGIDANSPIKVLRVRAYGSMKQGVVVTGGAVTTQWVFDTATGARATLSSPAYPPSKFPFGVQTHEDIKHFHSGEGYGFIARWLDLLAGMSLTFLCISGLWMYLQLWLTRRASGRAGFFWW